MIPAHRGNIRRADSAATQTQDDGQPTPTRLIFDTIQPAIPSLNSDVATPSPTSIATPLLPTKNGLSNATKLGLSMIPVVVLLTGLYIVFLFWYRRRRAARKKLCAPPVPAKDVASYDSSASRRRSSKVLNMAAFSTPLVFANIPPSTAQGQTTMSRIAERQTASVRTVQSSPDLAALHFVPGHARRKNSSIHINMAVASCPNITDGGLDSPIDGSSPFRLKRGDTVKRRSLGSDLFRLWPTPPTSTYIKPTRVYDEMHEQVPPLNIRSQRSTLRTEASRFSDWSPKQDARILERHRIAQHRIA